MIVPRTSSGPVAWRPWPMVTPCPAESVRYLGLHTLANDGHTASRDEWKPVGFVPMALFVKNKKKPYRWWGMAKVIDEQHVHVKIIKVSHRYIYPSNYLYIKSYGTKQNALTAGSPLFDFEKGIVKVKSKDKYPHKLLGPAQVQINISILHDWGKYAPLCQNNMNPTKVILCQFSLFELNEPSRYQRTKRGVYSNWHLLCKTIVVHVLQMQ